MTVKTPTLKSKKDTFEIYDGQIKIYRTTSKIWQFQMWVREEQKYVRESLHTEDKESATTRAQDRFVQYQARILQKEKIFSITANELRDAFLTHIHSRVQQNQLSHGRESVIKTFTKHYVNFVGKNTKIQNIDQKEFRKYLDYRRSQKSDILSTVVINEGCTIKQMYKFAIDVKYINATYIPDFGYIKKPIGEAIRDSFTSKEFFLLEKISKSWYKVEAGLSEEQIHYRKLIYFFIMAIANGGFRTQEVRLLKWKDIKKIYLRKGTTYAEIIIRAENTKIRKSRIIEITGGNIFEEIKSFSEFTEKEDFIFTQYKKSEVIDKTKLYDNYNLLTAEVKKHHQEFDEKKTLYSLRHLWITMRIKQGLNVYNIAKIAGTSLQQIQKHYDATMSLTTSMDMNKQIHELIS